MAFKKCAKPNLVRAGVVVGGVQRRRPNLLLLVGRQQRRLLVILERIEQLGESKLELLQMSEKTICQNQMFSEEIIAGFFRQPRCLDVLLCRGLIVIRTHLIETKTSTTKRLFDKIKFEEASMLRH